MGVVILFKVLVIVVGIAIVLEYVVLGLWWVVDVEHVLDLCEV